MRTSVKPATAAQKAARQQAITDKLRKLIEEALTRREPAVAAS